MRKKTVPETSKSLKTFFLYTGIVLALILTSLAVKAIFIFQHNKYDGQHTITVAIAQNGRVGKVIAFNPSAQSVSLLRLQETTIPISLVGKTLAIPVDAKVDGNQDIPVEENISSLLRYFFFHYNSIETDLTMFDIGRLYLLSENVPTANNKIKDLKVGLDEREQDKIIASLLTDDALSAEKMSIQIINATGISGIAKRLERVIVNMGGNVVAITTLQKEEPVSKIQYFGEETYTLTRLQRSLVYPVSVLEKETVADIVIIIGKDSVNTKKF